MESQEFVKSFRPIMVGEDETSYALYNILWKDSHVIVQLNKNPFDQGKVKSLPQWLEFTNKQEWKLPSANLLFAIYNAFFYNSSEDAAFKKIKAMLVDDLRRGLSANTIGTYKEKGPDSINHDGSLSGRLVQWQEKIPLDLFRDGAWINKDADIEDVVYALFGVGDLQEVENTFHWLTGKKPYLWLNKKGGDGTSRFNTTAYFSMRLLDDRIDLYLYNQAEAQARGVSICQYH